MAAKDLVKMDLNQLVYSWLKDILWPEKNYFWLAIIYGIGIALLGLATPISVQLLINSIANTGGISTTGAGIRSFNGTGTNTVTNSSAITAAGGAA